MKNSLKHIEQFDLSPLAKTGVFVITMEDTDRGEEHNVSAPHRDSHYLLMIGSNGRFRLNLDFEELSITSPAMLFVFPGQVHHVVEAENPEGWAISFDPALVDQDIQRTLERNFSGPVILDEKSPFFDQIKGLLTIMRKVQENRPGSYATATSHALLNALLNLIISNKAEELKGEKSAETRGLVITQAFGSLLKTHYKTWKSPSRYAEELAITTSHLNDTVKEATGNSVSEHIQQFAVLEAKRLLYFTDWNVKQIGYELGYEEPVYFNKLFKKITGITPLQFRIKFRE